MPSKTIKPRQILFVLFLLGPSTSNELVMLRCSALKEQSYLACFFRSSWPYSRNKQTFTLSLHLIPPTHLHPSPSLSTPLHLSVSTATVIYEFCQKKRAASAYYTIWSMRWSLGNPPHCDIQYVGKQSVCMIHRSIVKLAPRVLKHALPKSKVEKKNTTNLTHCKIKSEKKNIWCNFITWPVWSIWSVRP